MTSKTEHALPSVGVFSPQSKAPTAAYLNSIHTFLTSTSYLQPFVDAISRLEQTWQILANHRKDIAALKQGPCYMKSFTDWIATGDSGPIAGHMSGIFALPLLTIVQTCQYLQYLEARQVSHAEFQESLNRGGGIQGYCGGLLPAVAIACSSNEDEVVTNAITSMRIALGIGAYGEIGDDESIPGPTTIVLRLKRPEQGEELVKKFPGAYVSAITDPKTISIVGSVPVLEALSAHAREQGLLVQGIHLRGKVHNPENAELAEDLNDFACSEPSLTLPHSRQLRIPIRSNTNGKIISDAPLTSELIHTILARKCEWYTLLQETATDLVATGHESHLFAVFGIGDCIPLTPFYTKNLHITKLDVLSYIEKVSSQRKAEQYKYSEGAMAIVGAACRIPGADDLEELWQLMARGESRAVEVPTDRFDLHGSFKASLDQKWASKKKFWGNFIDDPDRFDHGFFRISPREAMNMDPQQRVLLEVAYQALDSSGYLRNHSRESADDVGCFIGASFVEYLDNTAVHAPTAFTSTGTIRAFLSGKISYQFGWHGPSEVIDTACSSSLVAINRACKAIQSGECSMALAGGVNVLTGIHNFLDLAKAGFLSPTGQCKPFDETADGYCRGEGCGLVLIRPLQDAVAEGQQILGVIPAIATNQGGLSPSITVPSSPAQKTLYKTLLKQSALQPEHISYVEAHGTGTQVGDPLEMASVREVFAGPSRATALSIGSLKANVGHAETAAGVQSLCKILTMLQHEAIPPIANFKSINPKIGSLKAENMRISTATEAWDVPFKVACINSYGAAGSNSAMLCSQPPQVAEGGLVENTNERFPLILSAHCAESLHTTAESLIHYLRLPAQKNFRLADVAFTLAERRKRHSVRLIASVSASLSSPDSLQHALKNATDISIPEQPRKVCLVFSGQSRRIVGLHKSTYQSVPRLRRYIDECDATLTDLGYPSMFPSIFSQEPINDVVLLQCGTLALQYACAMSWIDSGLSVAAVVGHSFGELTAMVVSGILSLQDGMRLIAARASLIQSKWGPERGIMLAVHTDKQRVATLIEDSGLSLEIACFNSSSSQVIVGKDTDVENFEKFLSAKTTPQIRSQRLDVSHAFHSIFTESILDDIEAVAKTLVFREAIIPFEPATSLPRTVITSDRIREHTRAPVYFEDAIKRVENAHESLLFLEAGIGSPITSMVKRAVKKTDAHCFVPVDSGSAGESTAGFLAATIKLWSEGIDTTYIPFFDNAKRGIHQVWLPPYKFQKTKHWLPNIDRVVEALRCDSSATSTQNSHKSIFAPPMLVIPKNVESSSRKKVFEVNSTSKRFQAIVGGHAVRGRALCPASMYMEFAVMALGLLGVEVQQNALNFSDIEYSSPLGLGTTRSIDVALSKLESHSSWHFEVTSNSRDNLSGKPVIHAAGTVDIDHKGVGDLWAYQRLVASRISQIPEASGAETLRSSRAYDLFSRVVIYGPVLRGIESVIIAGNEALATVRVPTSDADSGESTVSTHFDAVSLDVFIQVVGLMINSSGQHKPDEVFIASAIDQAFVTAGIDFRDSRKWTVYAIFTPQSDRKVSGDVFVLNQDGVLIMNYLGCRFTKMPVATLEKMLDNANRPANAKLAIDSVPIAAKNMPMSSSDNASDSDEEASSETSADTDITVPNGDREHESNKKLDVLKSTIAQFVGIDVGKLPEQARINDLGLDSLAAVELVDEIEKIFEMSIPSEEIGNESVNSIAARLQLTTTALSLPKNTAKPVLTARSAATPTAETSESPSQSSSTSFDYNKLLAVIADSCGVPINAIRSKDALQSLGVDSLAFVELKSSVEDAFDVSIDSDQCSLESTVQDMIDLLSAQGRVLIKEQAKKEDVVADIGVPNHPRTAELQQKNIVVSSNGVKQAQGKCLTFVYKVEDGVDIEADVYLPSDVPRRPMPIAIMVHAGGYMTLSRKAIRPHQTAHLLANGILPVSIDYLLCPEVNVLDGAIADVRDSVSWVQNSLPKLLERSGIKLDASRVGIIGWSTGGHLALTSAWTTRASGIQPPKIILSFYAPTDFESEDIDADRNFPERTIPIHDIRAALLPKPLTNYESKGDAKYLDGVGYVRPSDPRSALVLSMFKEGIGLPLILDGIPQPNGEGQTIFKRPDPARIESISPLAQVRKGTFGTPTCVVHSKADKVVGIDSADRFVSALSEAGVKHKFVKLEDSEHLHDLLLKPGSRQWNEGVEPAYDYFLEMLLR
ncbi:unnamed protein product [Periconia digitata]|uniref:Polyketide synthase n=1 Tax=Periconia digitata TaxID=1303443 RepID=A0A9W4U3A5_9PLEO|nr:unnamed protein product [Periconia digitata]